MPRIAPSFSDSDAARIGELAEREGTTRSGAVTRIVRAFLATGLAELPQLWPTTADAPPATAAASAPEPPRATPPAVADDEPQRPPWLPPEPDDRAGLAAWLDQHAPSIEALFARYPAELRMRADNWPADRLVAEAIWSLARWRDEIDAGLHPDPRIEVSFRAALRDTRALLESRARDVATQRWLDSHPTAVEDLLKRYPVELPARQVQELAADPLTAEAVQSLARWREEIDTGLHPDPRIQVAFMSALRGLHEVLRNRPTEIGRLQTAHIPDRTGPRAPPA